MRVGCVVSSIVRSRSPSARWCFAWCVCVFQAGRRVVYMIDHTTALVRVGECGVRVHVHLWVCARARARKFRGEKQREHQSSSSSSSSSSSGSSSIKLWIAKQANARQAEAEEKRQLEAKEKASKDRSEKKGRHRSGCALLAFVRVTSSASLSPSPASV